MPFDPTQAKYKAPQTVEVDENKEKQKKAAPKLKNGKYGDLPAHHPAAMQAKNIESRDHQKGEETKKAQTEASQKLVKADKWFEIGHDQQNFPKVGTKVCFRGPFRKYLDANKKNVSAEAGAPVWWEIQLDSGKQGMSVIISKRRRILRGMGQDCSVQPEPCVDEWKAIMKAPGKYLLMNEEARFIKAEKDGSVSMVPCENLDDIVHFKMMLWEVKHK